MHEKIIVTINGKPSSGRTIKGSASGYRFEAVVHFFPSAFDKEPWKITRLHIWSDENDLNPLTGAPCCVKYESGEWVNKPASYPEETATRAIVRELRASARIGRK